MARLRRLTRCIRWRSLLPVSLLACFSALSLSQARAGFIGDYAPGNFSLTNTNANGFALSPDGGLTLVLTGPNNGSDLPGTTDLTITAAGSGLVQFQYLYSSLDAPGFDFAGYLRGVTFVQTADSDGQTGSVLFPVNAGDSFGFRVGSLDNTGEPGILTISDFSAPASAASTVPEPGTASLLLVAAAVVYAAGKAVRPAAAGREGKV